MSQHACWHGAIASNLLACNTASCELGSAAVWQAQKVAELRADAPVRQLEFNGMGSWLAASTADGQVQLWRPALDGTWNLLMSVQGTPDEELLQVDSCS